MRPDAAEQRALGAIETIKTTSLISPNVLSKPIK